MAKNLCSSVAVACCRCLLPLLVALSPEHQLSVSFIRLDLYLDEGTGRHLSGGESFLPQNPVPDYIDHLVVIWVDYPESCDVCSSVFEILKINAVQILNLESIPT